MENENENEQNEENEKKNNNPLIEGEDFTYIPNINAQTPSQTLSTLNNSNIIFEIESNEDNESDIEENQEEDEDNEDNARIAFAEEFEEDEKYLFLPEYFPSKIGGKLSWIGGPLLKTENEKTCPICKEIMPLLLQLYAPLDWVSKSAYHRLLFILCCKNASCHSPRDPSLPLPFKVYRTHLPQDNSFIVDEDNLNDNKDDNNKENNNENDEKEFTDDDLKLFDYLDGTCEVCGWEGKKKCGKCKFTKYCSRQHQILDWKSGHDQQCSFIINNILNNNNNNNINNDNNNNNDYKNFINNFIDKKFGEKPEKKIQKKRKKLQSQKIVPARRFEHNFLFKEFSIESEIEAKNATKLIEKLKEGKLDEDDEDELIKEREESNDEILEKLKAKLKEYHGEAFDEEEWKNKNSPNRNFLIFQQVIADNPNQILRYHFDGTPLAITDDPSQLLSDNNDNNNNDNNNINRIPPCPLCNAPRVFEFQVFPQLLYYLNVEDGVKKESIDWGTLIVYTCSKNCEKENKDVYEEFLWRQMLESPFK